MTAHRCSQLGHVIVNDDHDRECLVCGKALTTTDTVGLTVNREHGEMAHAQDDIATAAEWGPLG